MKKLLNFSDKLVISLSFVGDVLIGAYANQYRWRKRDFFNYLAGGENTLRGSLRRLLKTSEIEKIIKNGEPFFRLTSAGKERIQRLFPISKIAAKDWDKKWRVVIFDIPEKERKTRNFLRNKLVSLGFGELQESVYISPLDVLKDLKEMLESYRLYGKVIVFEAKEIFSDPKEVARLVWRLDQLKEGYLDLVERIEGLKYLKEEERRKEKREINETFFNLTLKDPFLPKDLLPEDWIGFKVRALITKIV